MSPQATEVLAYMEKNGEIDQLTATFELGCTRLSARIFEIKAENVPIAHEFRKNPNTGKRYKAYWIRKEPPGATNTERPKRGSDSAPASLQT